MGHGTSPEAPTLRGGFVRLEPLQREHAPLLQAAAQHDDIWRYMPAGGQSLESIEDWIRGRLEPVAAGRAYAFTQFDEASGQAIGTTSLYDLDLRHRRGEIGWTWLARPYWGRGHNVEAKRLLLGFAFDTLALNRVQIKTDARNTRAQRSIEALGATREGTLRQHDVLPDGHVRDVALYSIVRGEWPAVAARLAERLARADVAESPNVPEA